MGRCCSPDPFRTGGRISRATYDMFDLHAGVKYQGWSLEGEYYLRWLSDFRTIGEIPVSGIFDHGFQLQASTMLVPQTWQAYVGTSTVFGDYGNPWLNHQGGFEWLLIGHIGDRRVRYQAAIPIEFSIDLHAGKSRRQGTDFQR
jgi:hypothetical protein